MTANEASVSDETEKIDEVGVAETSAEQSRPAAAKRLPGLPRKPSLPQSAGRWTAKIGPALVALLLVASLSVLGWQYWFSYQPNREVDAQAAKSAIAAASDGTIAILTYSPDTLGHDFENARSHLTGDFLNYYDNFTKQIVAPAAKQKSVKTTAVVLRGALTEFHPDSAVVLLFINQSTQSKDRPEPAMTSSSVLVTLSKTDGKWLISQFNPA